MDALLQPRTDAGVLAQAIVLLVVVVAVAWRVRHDADLVRLVVGAGVFGAGLFVLRAMH